ncbi:golgin subfamily A member 6-like protein 22 [Pituophis catenifer annectens]|uniref:golgin subfamily A member 6-like protein 22 n=1 Tax=Pituophis catenifer annectens TaxID=94852 RepID=UPI003994798A
MIQEGMNKTQECIANNHEETKRNHEDLKIDVGEIKDNIKRMDDKIQKIQQNIARNEQRIQKVETKMEQTDRKVEMMEQNQATLNKELKDSITYLEMEKASFYLRFQNVAESKEEDLGELMAGILEEAIQKDKEDIRRDMDEIYRVHTNYAHKKYKIDTLEKAQEFFDHHFVLEEEQEIREEVDNKTQEEHSTEEMEREQ